MEKQYDLAFLKDYFNDDFDFIEPILRLYIQETPKELSEIEKALLENNAAAAKALAHKIKTNIAMLGFVNTGTFLDDMHALQKEDNIPQELIKSFDQFREGVNSGLQQISEDFLPEEK